MNKERENTLEKTLAQIEECYSNAADRAAWSRCDRQAQRLLKGHYETAKQNKAENELYSFAEWRFFLLWYRTDGRSSCPLQVAMILRDPPSRSVSIDDFESAEVEYLSNRALVVQQPDLKLRYLEFAIARTPKDKIRFIEEAWSLLRSIAETEEIDESSWAYRLHALIRLWQLISLFSLEAHLDELETLTKQVLGRYADLLDWGPIERFIDGIGTFDCKKYFMPRMGEWIRQTMKDTLLALQQASIWIGVDRLGEAIQRAQLDVENVSENRIQALIHTGKEQKEKGNPVGGYSFISEARALAEKTGLKHLIAECEKELSTMAPTVIHSMKPIGGHVEIDLDKLYRELGLEDVKTYAQAVKAILSSKSFPQWEDVKEQVLSGETGVFRQFVPTVNIGEDGLPGSLVTEKTQIDEHRIAESYSVELLSTIVLGIRLLNKWAGSHDSLLGEVEKVLSSSANFPQHMRGQFKIMMQALRNKNNVEAMYIMPAFVEAYCRRLVSNRGGPVTITNKKYEGVINRIALTALLRELEPALGDYQGLHRALVFILNDPLGFNLRNTLYHGRASDEFMEGNAVEQLLLVLIVLSIIP